MAARSCTARRVSPISLSTQPSRLAPSSSSGRSASPRSSAARAAGNCRRAVWFAPSRNQCAAFPGSLAQFASSAARVGSACCVCEGFSTAVRFDTLDYRENHRQAFRSGPCPEYRAYKRAVESYNFV